MSTLDLATKICNQPIIISVVFYALQTRNDQTFALPDCIHNLSAEMKTILATTMHLDIIPLSLDS